MRHFLLFPPLFALWFAIAQYGLTVLWRLSFFLTLKFISPSHVHLLPSLFFEIPFQLFFKVLIVGFVVGAAFAVLDLIKHRGEARAEETLLRLLPNLLKSGAVAVALVLLYYGAFNIPQSLHLSRIPHSVYTPYRAVLSQSTWLPQILLLIALLWSIKKTLQPSKQSS